MLPAMRFQYPIRPQTTGAILTFLSGGPTTPLSSTGRRKLLRVAFGAQLLPVEYLSFSRVAFDSSKAAAYLWVDHVTCSHNRTSDCDGGIGALYRGERQRDKT